MDFSKSTLHCKEICFAILMSDLGLKGHLISKRNCKDVLHRNPTVLSLIKWLMIGSSTIDQRKGFFNVPI